MKWIPDWLKSRRALLEELKEERNIAHYFRSIVKHDFDQVELVDTENGPDGLKASFKSPGFAGVLAAFMAQSLKACGAKSYVELRATHPEYGPMIFSVRRENGETPAEVASRVKEELDDLERTFDLRWAADARAIKRWRQANPGNELVMPDHADLVVWLLGQLEAAGIRVPSEPTDAMVVAALEWAQEWMKEHGVDGLSPFKDYPPVADTTRGMYRAMLAARPQDQAPQKLCDNCHQEPAFVATLDADLCARCAGKLRDAYDAHAAAPRSTDAMNPVPERQYD